MRVVLFLAASSCLGALSASTLATTAAYWRFENGVAGTNVPHTLPIGAFEGTTPDVSGNGNDLSAFTDGGFAGYTYRTDVPFATVPATGAANTLSVKNTGGSPGMFTQFDSSTAGINIRTFTPSAFTVEASYKPETGGYRTVVVRDARNVANVDGSGDGSLAALYLQIRPDNAVGILFNDVSGKTHEAFSPAGFIKRAFNFPTDPDGLTGHWYHLAAVSNGSILSMYVDNQLVAQTDLTASGSADTSLAHGTDSGSDWTAGGWAVGRGLYNGGHGDRAYGYIDEVRISDSALAPSEFLAVGVPEPTSALALVSLGAMLRRRR